MMNSMITLHDAHESKRCERRIYVTNLNRKRQVNVQVGRDDLDWSQNPGKHSSQHLNKQQNSYVKSLKYHLKFTTIYFDFTSHGICSPLN